MNDQPLVSCGNCKNYQPGNRKPGSSPRKPQRLPEVLTHEEQEALLRQPNAKNLNGLRNLCLLRLMLNTGLRAAEVLKVKIRDIDWSSGKLMVRQGKGRKDRSLWVGEEDLGLLKLLIAKKARLPESELVFTNRDGKLICSRYLRTMVKHLATKAGISKDVHPHTLRHTFATDLFRQTKNLRLTQKALGHSQISSTIIYTHIVDDEMEDALKTLRDGGKTK
jgi:site-specific recombinase XerD